MLSYVILKIFTIKISIIVAGYVSNTTRKLLSSWNLLTVVVVSTHLPKYCFHRSPNKSFWLLNVSAAIPFVNKFEKWRRLHLFYGKRYYNFCSKLILIIRMKRQNLQLKFRWVGIQWHAKNITSSTDSHSIVCVPIVHQIIWNTISNTLLPVNVAWF